MLEFIRQRAGSWLVKIILGAIIVVFIFWGVGSFRARQANLLAKVNGEPITLLQFQRLYQERLDQLERMFRGQLNQQLLKQINLPQQVFEDLVRRVLLQQAAQKMGIKVTADEIRLAIAQIHVFQEKGRFSPERYRLILRQMRLTPQAFENEVRVQLLEAKLRHLLTAPVVATTNEAREFFNFENEALKVGYIKLAISSFTGQIKPTEKELQAYFKAHQQAYKTNLKIQLTYYLLPFSQVGKGVKVSEAEVKQYYEAHKDQTFLLPEARKLRHILVVVKPGEKEEEARQRAEKILAQIKSPKDFAAVAKKYSEDPHSKKDGGELGFVTKKELFPSLQEPVFKAKEGEIIGPLRSPMGYHIILVEKIRPKGYVPLEKVRDQIVAHLKEQKIKALAWDKANKIYDKIVLSGGLSKWAAKEHVKLGQTPLFSVESPPNLPILTPKVLSAAQKLEEGELGPPLEVSSGIVIFKLARKDEPHIPPFSQVKEQVKADYILAKAKELAAQKARAILKALLDGHTDIIEKEGLKLQQTPYFKRKNALQDSGLPAPVALKATTLGRKGQWLEEPVATAKAFYLLELIDYKKPDPKAFAQEKKAYISRLTQQKREQAFASWYAYLRETAEIKVYQKLPNP